MSNDANANVRDVARKPQSAAEWPAGQPAWWPEGTAYAPGPFRRIGIPFSLPATEQQDQLGEPHADQLSGFVTPIVTPSRASPVVTSVTPDATGAPVAGSICPTCNCRMPARLSSAERQRAYRERKREQSRGLVTGDLLWRAFMNRTC